MIKDANSRESLRHFDWASHIVWHPTVVKQQEKMIPAKEWREYEARKVADQGPEPTYQPGLESADEPEMA